MPQGSKVSVLVSRLVSRVDKFVDEMRKWAKNSPHSAQCWEVLEALRLLREYAGRRQFAG